MIKTICSAALIVAMALTGSKPVEGSGTTLSSPAIVAKVAVTGQSAVIPATKVFTPKVSGLYRISSYMAMTTPGSNASGGWYLQLNWTDDAGAEASDLLILGDTQRPSSAFAFPYGPGNAFTFRAVAGVPVSYSVIDGGSNANGTYELFFTVERLM